MHRDEQVSIDTARLLYAPLQRNEKVVVTRQHATHVRFTVDGLLEPARNRQSDVLFPGALAAFGAGIFAAVSCINGNDDGAARLCGEGRWRRLCWGGWTCDFRLRRGFGGFAGCTGRGNGRRRR